MTELKSDRLRCWHWIILQLLLQLLLYVIPLHGSFRFPSGPAWDVALLHVSHSLVGAHCMPCKDRPINDGTCLGKPYLMWIIDCATISAARLIYDNGNVCLTTMMIRKVTNRKCWLVTNAWWNSNPWC
jgi:hypothetical protein